MEVNMANAIAKLFGMKDDSKAYSGGLADRSANTIVDTNAYRKHVIDAQTNGEEPMSKEEFLRSRGNG
jgi:hypothetical protein